MTRSEEKQARLELTNAIDGWLGKTDLAVVKQFPYVGDNIAEIMANAALQVLLGVADTQDFLSREGMLVED